MYAEIMPASWRNCRNED